MSSKWSCSRVYVMMFLLVACQLISGIGRANANLIVNGDGTLSDTTTGLMWVQDGSYAGSVGAYTNGLMTWDQAVQFVADVDAGKYPNFGYTDWKLPSALSPDGSLCNNAISSGNCTESEMGTLYFGDGIVSIGSNAAPFTNLLRLDWTDTVLGSGAVMTQDFEDGGQNPFFPQGLTLSALLVRDIEDNVPVPEPNAPAAIGLGLAAIIILRRRSLG